MKNENARLCGDLQTIGRRICHDLRTPLGGIVTAGELLKETLDPKDLAAQTALSSLFASVDDLTRLIKYLNVLAKATAEPAAKEKVAMGAIVSGTLQRLESRLLKKGATVLTPDSWPEVTGVADWLEFIWWQFLANAVQYGGPKIQLGWERDKRDIRFWISDNGAGVPVELRAKLFQPFETLHAPDSARGLGLSVVRRLVELQGGHCGYTPAAHASKFHFTLPSSGKD